MRILFLTTAHNSLSQRLWIELGKRGHEISVCVAATDEAMIAAASREAPDLILAPMLKIAIPREVAPSLSDRASRHQGGSGTLFARLGHRQPGEGLGRNDPGSGGRVRCRPNLGLV